jgi:hypothetical protein
VGGEESMIEVCSLSSVNTFDIRDGDVNKIMVNLFFLWEPFDDLSSL